MISNASQWSYKSTVMGTLHILRQQLHKLVLDHQLTYCAVLGAVGWNGDGNWELGIDPVACSSNASGKWREGNSNR